MRYKFTHASITKSMNGSHLITIDLGHDIQAQSLNDLINTDKLKVVEIKPDRKKRSLDANAGLWATLNKMAAKLQTSKDELYIQMLERYGQFTHTIVKESAVDMMKKQFRLVKNLGYKEVGEQKGIQLQCYFGTSIYNTEQFSQLLDGVISEAKELGIDFITKDERNKMMEDYEKSRT